MIQSAIDRVIQIDTSPTKQPDYSVHTTFQMFMKRQLFMISSCCILIATFAVNAGAEYALTRGRQLQLEHGLQILSLVYPVGFSNVDLWKSANFTTYDFWEWSNPGYFPLLPSDQTWSRHYDTNYPFTKYLDPAEVPYKDRLIRYQYGDELEDLSSPARLNDIATTYAEWRQLYPEAIVHTNSYAGQITPEVLTNYMQVTQPDMVMFDYYPRFSFPTSDRNTWYSTMQMYRRAGLAGNDGTGNSPIPYAQFLNTYRTDYNQPKPSESYIRLQQNASWAFGYTFVEAFIYSHTTTGLAAAMFDSTDDSLPNEVFGYVAETNRQSRNLGPALVRMVSTDIRMIRGRNGFTFNPLPSGLSAWSSGTANTGGYADYLTSIQPTISEGGANDTTYGDVLVGYFNPLLTANQDATFVDGLKFMIVNGSATGTAAQSAQWYRLNFNFAGSDNNSLVRLSRDTGNVELVNLTHAGGSNYYFDLNLPGGTGDLFGYWNSSNPLPTIHPRVGPKNGDFENLEGWGPVGDFFPPAGWETNYANTEPSPVSQQSGANAIGGSGTSARFSGNANGFSIVQAQNFSSPWVFEYDFAAEDAGGDSGRTADMAITLAGNANIYMRVVDVNDNGLGDIQFHGFASGSGWTSIPELADKVIFSPNVEVDPAVNHIQIVSHFDQAVPTYDAILTNANGTFTAPNVTLFSFFELPPRHGGAITKIGFSESQTSGARWLLDNVSLAADVAPAELPGDYNDDGTVDAADYVIWRKGGPLQNDPTTGVQPNDYYVWLAHFGESEGGGASSAYRQAAPEPPTVAMFLIAGLIFALTRCDTKAP